MSSRNQTNSSKTNCGDRFEPVIGGSTGVGGWVGGWVGGCATGVHHPSPPLVVVSSNPLKKTLVFNAKSGFPNF